MSDILVITGNVSVSSEVKKYVPVPSFYKDKYGSYFGVVSKELYISIYPRKEHPSISLLHPDSLVSTHRSLDEPMEEEAFWKLYNQTNDDIQRLVTPFNTSI